MRQRTDNRGLVNEKVRFDLSYARRTGTVVKNNEHTVLVKFVVGNNKTITIKRHKVKHNVRRINGFVTPIESSVDVMWESGGSYARSLLE